MQIEFVYMCKLAASYQVKFFRFMIYIWILGIIFLQLP